MTARGATVLVLAVLVVAAVGVQPVAARNGGDERLVQNLDALAQTYNDNLDAVPDVFASQLANERVDVRVAAADGEHRYYAETGADARVARIERGAGPEPPTVRVRTDEATLDAIRTSETPAATAVAAYDDGRIEITGVGVVNAVTVETAKAALGVGRALGLV